MLHPSQVAIDYIFDRFSKFIISKDIQHTSDKVLKIRKAALHRPVNSYSVEYEKFLQSNLEEITKLIETHPQLNFNEEKIYFEQELERFHNSES